MTPSGTISCACWAAEPCQTPSERVALPLTAAASGTVQSTRIWPGRSASRRLLRFSDWARKGTVRKTISPRWAASSFSSPVTSAPGTAARIFAAASSARSAEREPSTTGTPAWAQRAASPAPRAPVPPTIGIGSLTAAPVYAAATVRLEGRKALVTGGASGIGAAIAARLAAEGAEVWVGDIDTEGAEKVAGEVAGHPLELDVTEIESARAAVEATGTLDILVNNAGTDEFGFFTYTTPEQWQRVLAINLGRRPQLHPRGAAGDAAGEVRPHRQHLLGGGPGRLQGLRRLLGRQGGDRRLHEGDRPRERPLRGHRQRDRPRPDRDAAADGRQGVRRDRREGDRDDEGSTQLGRLGQPDEVAAAVAFLASDDATYVTGETLGVCGGLGMV